MLENAIVKRILADAEAEKEEILASARQRAQKELEDAQAEIAREDEATRMETEAKANSIMERKQATARLDSAKILLAEKRKLIDEIYIKAFHRLKEQSREEAVSLAGKLLSAYAEEGDEIVFATDYSFVDDVMALPVVKERSLTQSAKRENVGGGFILRGKRSDKDVSFASLLAIDRDDAQAEIAEKLFHR